MGNTQQMPVGYAETQPQNVNSMPNRSVWVKVPLNGWCYVDDIVFDEFGCGATVFYDDFQSEGQKQLKVSEVVYQPNIYDGTVELDHAKIVSF